MAAASSGPGARPSAWSNGSTISAMSIAASSAGRGTRKSCMKGLTSRRAGSISPSPLCHPVIVRNHQSGVSPGWCASCFTRSAASPSRARPMVESAGRNCAISMRESVEKIAEFGVHTGRRAYEYVSRASRSRSHSPLRQRSGKPSPRPLYFFTDLGQEPGRWTRRIMLALLMYIRKSKDCIGSSSGRARTNFAVEGRHRLAPAVSAVRGGSFFCFWSKARRRDDR